MDPRWGTLTRRLMNTSIIGSIGNAGYSQQSVPAPKLLPRLWRRSILMSPQKRTRWPSAPCWLISKNWKKMDWLHARIGLGKVLEESCSAMLKGIRRERKLTVYVTFDVQSRPYGDLLLTSRLSKKESRTQCTYQLQSASSRKAATSTCRLKMSCAQI